MLTKENVDKSQHRQFGIQREIFNSSNKNETFWIYIFVVSPVIFTTEHQPLDLNS